METKLSSRSIPQCLKKQANQLFDNLYVCVHAGVHVWGVYLFVCVCAIIHYGHVYSHDFFLAVLYWNGIKWRKLFIFDNRLKVWGMFPIGCNGLFLLHRNVLSGWQFAAKSLNSQFGWQFIIGFLWQTRGLSLFSHPWLNLANLLTPVCCSPQNCSDFTPHRRSCAAYGCLPPGPSWS